MDLRRLLAILHCILAVALIAIAAPFAWYAPHSARNLAASSEQAALVSTETLNLIGSATSLIGDRASHRDGTLFGAVYQVGEVAEAAQPAVRQLGALSASGTATLKQSTQLLAQTASEMKQAEPAAAETKRKLDNIIDQFATLPPHLNQTADNAAEVLNTLNDFAADAKTSELRDRFSQLLADLHPFTTGATVIEGDIHAYIKPYDGAHPKRHAIWQFTQSTLGIGSKGAQIAYHGIGAAKGQ